MNKGNPFQGLRPRGDGAVSSPVRPPAKSFQHLNNNQKEGPCPSVKGSTLMKYVHHELPQIVSEQAKDVKIAALTAHTEHGEEGELPPHGAKPF